MKRTVLLACTMLLTACSSPAIHPPGAESVPASPAAPAASPVTSEKSHPLSYPAPASQTTAQHRYVVNPVTYQIGRVDRTRERIVLLTFDDGPEGDVTRRILDVLDRHKARSIWFVNGYQLAAKRPDGTIIVRPEKAELLREIRKRGHLIGNHTWWHENLRQLSPARQREEMVSTSEVIRRITGESPRYFRPPFGAYTETSQAVATSLGMQSMNWSVGSLDWDPQVYKKPDGILRQVLKTVRPGANILFHDRPWTADELDDILTALEKQGYRFVIPTEVAMPMKS